MASTIWKGQLTFGLVSFPVRLVKAARKERIPLKYVRETREPEPAEEQDAEQVEPPSFQQAPNRFESTRRGEAAEVAPVRQAYVASSGESFSADELQRGYEVAPQQFVVVRPEELRRLRPATSTEIQILRSVPVSEIDPVFLETSYYVIPGSGGERSYGLFYRALVETQHAALAQMAMHGRDHIVIVRAGNKGLIAHTMYYVTEVRSDQEYASEMENVAEKELDLAKRFVEAITDEFRPEEFTDRYREQLEELIASKQPAVSKVAAAAPVKSAKVIDIMDALRKSLQQAVESKAPAEKKPAMKAARGESKARRRKA